MLQVDDLYQRDIARMGGEAAGKMDDEYNSFLAELGGGPPAPSSGGAGRGMGAPHHGLGFNDGGRGPRARPGDELPDDCKLYVGNLSPVITDSMLKQIMEPFGNVLHAVVLMDMNTNQSRGYGFVHMDNAISAGNASKGMHGKVRALLYAM